MLVDNAIVIIDGMLVRIKDGMDAEEAAREVTSQTSTPLLGATAVAIIAFAAIGLSPDSTGEFCRSLFIVIAISLSLSWVTAMTITPLLGIWFLKPPTEKELSDSKGAQENALLPGLPEISRTLSSVSLGHGRRGVRRLCALGLRLPVHRQDVLPGFHDAEVPARRVLAG